jgi:hypothetical protein
MPKFPRVNSLQSTALFLAISFLGSGGWGERSFASVSSPDCTRTGSQSDRAKAPLAPAEPIKLEWKGCFPNAEHERNDIYFYSGSSLAKDQAGNILVLDAKAMSVLEFQPDGRFIRKFGRAGQGPGEFEFPVKILCYGKSRYVLDSGQRRLHIFDQAGNFERTIKTQYSYYDLAMGANGTLLAARHVKAGGDHLVDALDEKGAVLFSFAEFEKQGSIPPEFLNLLRLASNERSDVILAFQTLGKLRIYDRNGTKLRELWLQSRDMDSERSYNTRQFEKIAGGERVGYHHILEAIRSVGDTTYIMRVKDKGIEIRAFDREFRVSAVYLYETGEHYYGFDFEVVNDSNGPAFYVLEITPENKVDILAPGNVIH